MELAERSHEHTYLTVGGMGFIPEPLLMMMTLLILEHLKINTNKGHSPWTLTLSQILTWQTPAGG